MGLDILILICIWLLVFHTSIFQRLTLYFGFGGEKIIHLLKVLLWGFGGFWGFLTRVWHLNLDLDIVTCLWYIHDPNFGSLTWFWGCKEHPCPWSPDLGLWRMLEVPDWGLASWSWFGYGHWSLIHPFPKFWLYNLILMVQRTSMFLKSWFGAFGDAGGLWLGFGIVILIGIWSLVFDIPMIWIWALYLDFEGAKNIHVL